MRICRPFGCAVLLGLATCGPPPPTLDLPPRALDADGGEQVAEQVRDLEFAEREAQIFAEVAAGNVPGWFRELKPVKLNGKVAGESRRITFWTTPDYLAVGSDEDFVLFPVSPATGQRIADLVGGSFPTPTMVDAIFVAARTRFPPVPIRPSSQMTTVTEFVHHNDIVAGQRRLYRAKRSALVAGHKKDVVIAAVLGDNPGRVAIYGWHQLSGQPIQPLYTGHLDSWVDYSHGLRLVHRDVVVDGSSRDLLEVLGDPGVAPLLSTAGVIGEPRYPLVLTHPPGASIPDTLGLESADRSR